jgi:hypothetical protein
MKRVVCDNFEASKYLRLTSLICDGRSYFDFNSSYSYFYLYSCVISIGRGNGDETEYNYFFIRE